MQRAGSVLGTADIVLFLFLEPCLVNIITGLRNRPSILRHWYLSAAQHEHSILAVAFLNETSRLKFSLRRQEGEGDYRRRCFTRSSRWRTERRRHFHAKPYRCFKWKKALQKDIFPERIGAPLFLLVGRARHCRLAAQESFRVSHAHHLANRELHGQGCLVAWKQRRHAAPP